MKRTVIIMSLLLCCLVQSQGQAIFSISTGPGEDASSQMGISWATDSSLNNTVVIYTKESDRNWDKAITVEPEQKYFCTAFDGVLSETPDGKVCREKARFNKCGAMLRNLAKDTEYKYVIATRNGNGEKSTVHHFKTAGAREWSCCVISDFHSYTPLPGRLESAMGMIQTVANYDKGIDFVFSAGDVVAWGGSYSFWKRLFEEPMFEKYLWARVNGNHDNWTKEGCQKREYDIPSDFWLGTSYFPRNGYDIPHIDGSEKQSDSQMGLCYHFRYGNTLFVMLNTEDMFRRNELQAAQDWARKVISEAKASKDAPTFVVVCMHYEWFIGTNGRTSMFKHWSELFDEVGVDLAIAGNNHVYLRTEPIFNGKVNDGKSGNVQQARTANRLGTVYMQTSSSDNGRGRALSEKESLNRDLIQSRWSEGPHTVSAIHMKVNSKSIELKLLNRDGFVIDSTAIVKK